MDGGLGCGGASVAPILFVLLWSTGFVGAKFGLPYAEPFTFLWVRMVIVAGLPLGLLLHAGYLGGVFFAISRGMPAGLAALIVGLQPILTALLA